MTETTAALKELAGTPMGLTVLIGVGILVALGGGLLLWRALKYLFKASMWLLLLLVVLALAAGAVWVWMEYKTPDPGARARLREEVVETLRGDGIEKALERARAKKSAGNAAGGGDAE